MEVHGRRMPQPPSSEWPRYRDRQPDDFTRTDVNPYMVRHHNHGPPVLTASQVYTFRDRWAECFDRDAPLHVEIGSGNGLFLAELARRNPDWNILGIEIRYKRVEMCAEKLDKIGVTNARIARYDAWYLDDLFRPGSLAGLYVNHPDPWPKTRHLKNRLISRWFLEEASSYLKPGGWLRLKSDFEDNVDRVPRLLSSNGRDPMPLLPLKITGRGDNIITGPAPWPNDIETNYQSKYRKRGLPVYAIELRRSEGAYSPPPKWKFYDESLSASALADDPR
ncbi:MAG: tRNA (guanine-N7-)-methyltransferase [Kiritimatiellia bacterium]|jgi:tRNA (guanine-N7-)-methyltransferase